MALRTLRGRLHAKQFASILISEGVRRALNPAGRVSYAQNAEDILIASLLSWPTKGFYVDVGCNHPIRRSNTYLLYLRGLSGIAIDGNDAFASAFRTHRPLDRFVPALVGDGSMVEFHIFESDCLSSVGGERVTNGVSEDQYIIRDKKIMQTMPLNDILTQNQCPATFDVLSIDVEGHDLAVLETIDLAKFRPKLIVVEAHAATPGAVEESYLAQRLRSDGYIVAAVQRSNVFFLSE